MKRKVLLALTAIVALYIAVVVGYNLAQPTTAQSDSNTTITETVEEVTPVYPAGTTVESDTEYSDSWGTGDCTSDCSGHEAGYDWADENGVCDEYFEGGNSDSFNEGVQAYAMDNCYE